MSNWNDDRLDRRDEEVKEGFATVDEQFSKVDERLAQTATLKEMNEGFNHVYKRLESIDDRFAALERTLLAGAIALIIAALIGFH